MPKQHWMLVNIKWLPRGDVNQTAALMKVIEMLYNLEETITKS